MIKSTQHLLTVYRLLLLLAFSQWSVYPAVLDLGQHLSTSAFSLTKALLEKSYATIGQHDGGRLGGFFIPISAQDESQCAWIDTSASLQGTHVGYRRFLNQSCFIGAYVGYDVLYGFNPFVCPTRLNLGAECSIAFIGKATVNWYGFTPKSGSLSRDENDAGISAKLAFHHLPFRVLNSIKPFIGVAKSWAKSENNDSHADFLFSANAGIKWVLNHWIDFELKYVYDEKGAHCPIGAGFQIRLDKVDPRVDYFRSQFKRPPDRYTPYCAKPGPAEKFQSIWNNNPFMGAQTDICHPGPSGDQKVGQSSPQEETDTSNSDTLTAVSLSENLEMRIDNNFFPEDTLHRADQLARLNGMHKLKLIDSNIVSLKQGNMSIDIVGNASESDLKQLWTDPEISKQWMGTASFKQSFGVSIGIMGSPASLLYGLNCCGKDCVQYMLQSFANHIASATVIHTDNRGKMHRSFLIGSPMGIQAERKAMAAKLLPDFAEQNRGKVSQLPVFAEQNRRRASQLPVVAEQRIIRYE